MFYGPPSADALPRAPARDDPRTSETAAPVSVSGPGSGRGRVSALLTLPGWSGRRARPREAARALARLRETLTARPESGGTAPVPGGSPKHRRVTDLGVSIVDEYHEVARAAAADPGLAEEVREVTEAAAVLLSELSEAARRSVRR